MESAEMFVLDKFCSNHEVDISFVQSLEEYGLIETIIVNETLCIQGTELPKLEQIIRLQKELNINPEGVDAIMNLLKRIENIQNEITVLRNRLNFYEEDK